MREARLFLRGAWTDGAATATVEDKFSGAPVTVLHTASRRQVAAATRDVAEAQAKVSLTPHQRYTILDRAARLLEERQDAFIQVVMIDTGFTTADARREVARSVETLRLSAEEAKRVRGEMVPLDAAPDGGSRLAFTVRRPLGVICAITPFNSPLNTVLHKIAPALAAGNGAVLKPAALTPLTAVALVQLLLDAGLPERLLALVHGDGGTVGQWLLEDPVPAFYAFTGSTPVGEHIRRTVGLRHVQLEMGSLSSTFVCDDAALERAAQLCVDAAFRKAGQVCTSVQRLYVQRGVLDELSVAVTGLLAGRRAGDPADPDVFVGPVISGADAERIQDWVDGAARRGATVLAGGRRLERVVEPTVLTDVPADCELMCREVFGPVVALRPFDDLDAAIDEANDTPYGLAAGIFTRDIDRALTAAERLRMGSVHINATSSSRVDLMPYGGVKASGLGKEGPRYAVAEMTEERLITLGRP